ncbi:hypothetical protein BC828DRAFT_409338 [Blastocladiella britannica]|nr:hypothetical protein BC828DRAFT_409338 [Blastocladiella britannica]
MDAALSTFVSPIMWNIFYDLLLCALNDQPKGIELSVELPAPLIGYPGTTLIGTSIQLMIDIISSSNYRHGVWGNAKKLSIMALSFTNAQREGMNVFMGRAGGHPGQRIYVAEPNESVHSTRNCKDTAAFWSIKSIFDTRLLVLRQQQMTNYMPTISQLQDIGRACCAVIRGKLKQIKGAPPSAVYTTTGLLSFEQLVHEQSSAEFQVAVIDDGVLGAATRYQLALLQSTVGVPFSPLEHPLFLEATKIDHWMSPMLRADVLTGLTVMPTPVAPEFAPIVDNNSVVTPYQYWWGLAWVHDVTAVQEVLLLLTSRMEFTGTYHGYGSP